MTPAEFIKRRDKIEQIEGRSKQWRDRAMRRLLIEAQAVVVMSSGRKIGWQMLNGQVVCIKQRYRNERQAEEYLQMILSYSNRQETPQRAYHCPNCCGWHLTHHA